MKYAWSLLAVGMLFASCQQNTSEGFRVEGQLQGDLPDGTQIILRKSDENMQSVDMDTALLEQGSFSFAGSVDEPELYYLFVDGLRGGMPLILENGTIHLSAHKDSLHAVTLSGTHQNDVYTNYVDGARRISQQRLSINEEMQSAVMEQDTAVMASLRDEYFELLERMNNYEMDFVRENPDALISALILTRLLQSQSAPTAQIDSLYAGLDPAIQATAYGKRIGESLQAARGTAIGSPAPDFSAPTPEGGELSLQNALGKITLVDFWAAWCRPCRAENPNIVRVYNKYKDKGLQVLGVSLDRNAEDWKRAIEADGLDWHHVSNLRYFDEIAALYNVNAIPASFILDENGIIIAKNLRGPELEAKIAELLP